jgi:class 3 adenylate cyclase
VSDGVALLVVDDNEDNRFTLTRRLARQGYENVAEAVNGREALDRLGDRPFDLVLLDIMMPEMNGYEVLERMKADMDLRDIPVIMISAIDDMDSVVRCIKLGAEDYLPKPFNSTLLKARLGACLEKKRMHDQEASYLRQIETEKKRVDEILHAILPSAAIQELKTTNTVKPRRYESVAVVICDIVGFTAYCDGHPPEKVVANLEIWVDAIERIVQKHGLEKIKTIGDAFMATAGLHQHVAEPALASLRCAFDMLHVVDEIEAGWNVRIGVHIGPVVAGVMGSRQYSFDLWGDTVNVAARIVAEAEPGSVLVSNAVWQEVRGQASGRSRGKVDLKGKGTLELIECSEEG